MNSIYEKLTTCLASVREKTDFVPETAIVLGWTWRLCRAD